MKIVSSLKSQVSRWIPAFAGMTLIGLCLWMIPPTPLDKGGNEGWAAPPKPGLVGQQKPQEMQWIVDEIDRRLRQLENTSTDSTISFSRVRPVQR